MKKQGIRMIRVAGNGSVNCSNRILPETLFRIRLAGNMGYDDEPAYTVTFGKTEPWDIPLPDPLRRLLPPTRWTAFIYTSG